MRKKMSEQLTSAITGWKSQDILQKREYKKRPKPKRKKSQLFQSELIALLALGCFFY
jgi:hypothetical protein